jgi:hypothetical protein
MLRNNPAQDLFPFRFCGVRGHQFDGLCEVSETQGYILKAPATNGIFGLKLTPRLVSGDCGISRLEGSETTPLDGLDEEVKSLLSFTVATLS